MASRSAPILNTTGRIARRLGVPLHRVDYVIKTRPHIAPSAFAGRLRLFDAKAVAFIRHELSAIDARAEKGAERMTGQGKWADVALPPEAPP